MQHEAAVFNLDLGSGIDGYGERKVGQKPKPERLALPARAGLPRPHFPQLCTCRLAGRSISSQHLP
jgi:hypothetical protein